MSDQVKCPGAGRARFILALLILLPLAADWISIVLYMHQHTLEVRRVEFAVISLSFLYALAAGWALRSVRSMAKLAVATYAILLMLAAGEIGMRILSPRRSFLLPWPPMHRVSVLSVQDMPGLEPDVEFSVNKLGLRGPEVNLDQMDVKVLCVGGSTTECLYVSDKISWPWAMQEKLAQKLGKKVFVGNSGHGGDIAVHHAYLLQNYGLTPKFDYVLVLCGANDMGAMISQNYEQRLPNIAGQAFRGEPELVVGTQMYFRRMRLTIALLDTLGRITAPKQIRQGQVVLQDGTCQWIRERRAERRKQLALNPRSDLPDTLPAAVKRYQDDLRKIIAACRANQQKLIFLTQPAIYRPDLSPQEQALIWQLTMESGENRSFVPATLQQMMDAFNRGMIEVCRQEKVECIDLASILPKDTTVFFDDFHFNPTGCQRIAEIVSDYLAQKEHAKVAQAQSGHS